MGVPGYNLTQLQTFSGSHDAAIEIGLDRAGTGGNDDGLGPVAGMGLVPLQIPGVPIIGTTL